MEGVADMVIDLANIGLAIAGLIMTIWGVRHFQSGIIVSTLKRGQIASLLLLVHFITEGLADLNLGPAGVSDIFGLGFMVALAYVTWGFIDDWNHVERFTTRQG